MKKLLLLTILLLSILHVNALDTLKVVKVFELETDDYVYNIIIDSIETADGEPVFCFQTKYSQKIIKTSSKGVVIDVIDNPYPYFTILNGDTIISSSNAVINATSGDSILNLPGNVYISSYIASSSNRIYYYLDHRKRSPTPCVIEIITGKTMYDSWNVSGLCCSGEMVYIIERETGETAKLTYLKEDGSNMNQARILVKKPAGITEYRGGLYLYSQTDNSVYRLELPRNIETAVGSIVEADGMKEAVHYGLDGRITDPSTPGVHIIRLPDGTVSKTIVTR